MRVGIYDPYLDDVGGGEKYMLTVAELLSRNHDVSVFWNNKEDLDKAMERFSLDLSRVSISSNIFSSNVSFIKRFNASKKFDIIIVLSDGSIPFVSCRLLLHFQRPMEHVKLSLFNKLKIKRVEKVFCNSRFTRSFIDKEYGVKSLVIYPPVALHPKKMKKQQVILHVGRFRAFDRTVGANDFKKQGVMIKAFKEMVDQGLNGWKLILAISVQDKDKELFEELKKGTRDYPIEFEINRKNDDLWEFYSKANIYWHASGYGEDIEKNPELAEHFGISTVEAMGVGCVPVVFNAGGQKEIVEDGINGFTWDTIDEFKEKTLTLTNSKNLLDKLSSLAKKRAEDFSKEAFCRKVEALIK